MTGEKDDRDIKGDSIDGFFSTRTLLMAAVITSLGGSGTAVFQSSDRWTASNHEVYSAAQSQEREADRRLIRSEYAALAQRISALEAVVAKHQDGHPDRVEALVERLSARMEKNEDRIQEVRRDVDKNHGNK